MTKVEFDALFECLAADMSLLTGTELGWADVDAGRVVPAAEALAFLEEEAVAMKKPVRFNRVSQGIPARCGWQGCDGDTATVYYGTEHGEDVFHCEECGIYSTRTEVEERQG